MFGKMNRKLAEEVAFAINTWDRGNFERIISAKEVQRLSKIPIFSEEGFNVYAIQWERVTILVTIDTGDIICQVVKW